MVEPTPAVLPDVVASPKLVDVARLAGVSRGTVSNVLNHPKRVVPATLERVLEAIDELGYVRNDAARSLAAGRSASLGFVIPNIENTLFVEMTYGAQRIARDAGLTVLLGNSADDHDQQDEYLDRFDEARVAGVLLAPMEESSDGIRRMRAHGRPIVLLNYDPADHDCCAVLVDNEAVGYLAAQHLIDIGRTRIAFLAGHDDWQPVQDRRRGIRRAVESANADVELVEVETNGLFVEHALPFAEEFLASPQDTRVDAVIGVTDNLAYGFVERVTAQGASVPDDVAVVGCEGNRSAVRATVAVTTVGTSAVEMGASAARMLLEELESGPASHRHRTEVFPPELVIRASTRSI